MHTAAYYDKLNEWYNYLFEGSLESDFQQYGQMEKQRWEQSEKRREEKKEERRSEKKEDRRRERVRAREKVEKSRNIAFFQWFVVPEGRKVGSLKRRVRSHLDRWEIKSCTPLWREAHVEVKMHKAP